MERYINSFHDCYIRVFYTPVTIHNQLDTLRNEACTIPRDARYTDDTWPPMYTQRETNCHQCARSRANKTGTRHLKLFAANGPLEFIPIDNLGTLPKAINGNQFVVIISDRYSNLTRAGPASKTSMTHMATIFYDNSTVPNEIPPTH